jgi:medium-chain acyl-[acyl-carrier-protein] hydrolase
MQKTVDADRWFLTRGVNPHARLNLFCFPYAGGGAQVFRNWQAAFDAPTGVQVWPIQYPGRGGRLREQPYTDWRPLVEAMVEAVFPLMNKPFVFFGHSMGATLAFELARLLRDRHGLEPRRLFVSGRRAPQVPETDAPTYELPDDEFRRELRRLNGTPAELLEHPELMELMLPIIRADFKLTQTYEYTPGHPLACPFSVYGGLRDADVTREHLEGWCEHTTGPCSLKMFDGDHFFLIAAETQILAAVRDQLFRNA